MKVIVNKANYQGRETWVSWVFKKIPDITMREVYKSLGRLQLAHYSFQRFATVPVLVFNLLFTSFNWPSHVKLKLASSCWQTQIGVCVNDTTTCWQTVGEKLARIETSSIFANSLPTCCCVVHTHQYEFANTNWPT